MKRNFSLPCRGGLWAGAVLTAALAAGCVPSTSTPAVKPPSTGVPTFGAGDMPPGTHVQVARQGQWYPAVVVQPLNEGRFLVHYDNTGNEWNEAVGPDRIKPLAAGASAGGPARDYHAGEKVLVSYQNRLLFADVVTQVSADSWRVHYDGYGTEAGETVGPERLRRPFVGTTGHAVGESVTVDVNGQSVAGKVLAASSADHWVVRFEAFGPQYDQEVGIDRIKAASAAVAPPKPETKPVEPPPAKSEPKAEAKSDAKPEKPVEKPKPAAAAVVDGAPTVPSGPPTVGEGVLVNQRGAWFAAAVTAVGAGTVKVKFAAGGEEDLPADRILRAPASTKGQHYLPGQLVLVDYKGVFVPGKVTKQDGKDYKIRFDGQGPEGDEVITVKRLRPR
jgi:Agenet domain